MGYVATDIRAMSRIKTGLSLTIQAPKWHKGISVLSRGRLCDCSLNMEMLFRQPSVTKRLCL